MSEYENEQAEYRAYEDDQDELIRQLKSRLAARDAQLAEAQAQVAALRNVVTAIQNPLGWLYNNGRPDKEDRDWLVHLVDNALAATPADCRKRIEARVLREAAKELEEDLSNRVYHRVEPWESGYRYAVVELERLAALAEKPAWMAEEREK